MELNTSRSLSIILPCLNEAETIARVIAKSFGSLEKNRIAGEVIVADNGSTDGSQQLASTLGAKVVHVESRGYGAAVMGGLEAASGSYVIMGDSDDSYSLDELENFIKKLDDGFDLVMGNRFKGGIAPGAMPFLHKYLGNPVLSWIGRLFFKIEIGDFHCGLRAFRREAIQSLNLRSKGMEFASEMVVKAALNKLSITEVPTALSKDGRSRKPHLRTWRDGWRHLIFLLAASPRWLFFYPSILLMIIGFAGLAITAAGEFNFGKINLDFNTFLLSLAVLNTGFQLILFAILARVFSSKHGFLPKSSKLNFFEKNFTLERGILLGIILILVSVFGVLILLIDWNGIVFQNLNAESAFRISGSVVLTLTMGVQLIFASFFASLIQS